MGVSRVSYRESGGHTLSAFPALGLIRAMISISSDMVVVWDVVLDSLVNVLLNERCGVKTRIGALHEVKMISGFM